RRSQVPRHGPRSLHLPRHRRGTRRPHLGRERAWQGINIPRCTTAQRGRRKETQLAMIEVWSGSRDGNERAGLAHERGAGKGGERGRARVRVVDDDNSILDTVTWILESEGHQVMAASGGEEARPAHPARERQTNAAKRQPVESRKAS